MPQPIHTKYTTRSTGIWELIRKWLVLVPNRSSGNPIVPLYRNPPPGGQPGAKDYKDPITLPSGDIINNTYYKRDHRRNYPKISSFDQSSIAGLLSFGSLIKPNNNLLKGNEGKVQLEVYSNGEGSLNEVLKKQDKFIGKATIAPDLGGKLTKNFIVKDSGMYDDSYPVRMFNVK